MTADESATSDSLILRFDGQDEDGTPLHELRAAHLAEVLEGLVGFSNDMAKAGAFGDGPAGSEVLVRPAQEGSFILEVVRFVQDTPEVQLGTPSLGTLIWYATRHARADVSDFEYLENGNVKIAWQDNTVNEVPRAAWEELQKRKRRRKKHLRQIMAPLSDQRVTSVEVTSSERDERPEGDAEPVTFELKREDYEAVRPDQEIEEKQQTFEVEGQMSAIDFDNPERWRVKTVHGTRSATVEDADFLGRVAGGLAIRKNDIFSLDLRVDTVKKNGKTRNKWTVVKVKSHRRAAHDDDE